MDAPAAQYVRTSDGKTIAYGVSGRSDAPPLVLGPIPFSHVQLIWGAHSANGLIQALAERFHVVHFDPRGLGMSARGLGDQHRFDDRLLDIEAVVDAERLRRFVLLGAGFGGHVAARYSLQNPERVAALVLFGVTAVWDPNMTSMYQAAVARDFELYLTLMADPSKPLEYREQQLANLKRIITVEDHNQLQRAWAESGGIEAVLQQLNVPTMFLQSRGFRLVSESEAANAAQLAHAPLFVIDGAGAYGEPLQAVRAIESFLADLPPGQLDAPGTILAGLSERQIEVLRLLAEGRSNQQIADQLVISRNTVQRHVSNIFDKIGTANRVEATVYARDHGLA